MTVQDERVLEVATAVLVADPAASLGEVAAAAGMSRTSLHTRYPTRTALLVALAHQAMSLIEEAYAAAGVAGPGSFRDVTERVVAALLPLGPRVAFLLRERALDAQIEVEERYATLDQPVIDRIDRAQADGEVRADLPAWWIAEVLFAAVTGAWEAIADGRLAPRDAPALVTTTVLDGLVPR